MSHNRDIRVEFHKTFIKYQIPTYFPQEEGSIVIQGKMNRYGSLEIVAFSPQNKLLPLLQEYDDIIPAKAPQLLPEPPRGYLGEGAREEKMDTILSSEQGSNQTTAYYETAGCCPRK